MVLPTQVNIINDSSQRIKVKIDNDKDRKYDEITNIEPGERYETSGSVWFGKADVVIDIITNPPGPGNNERHGTFEFNNPVTGAPWVESRDFKYGYIEEFDQEYEGKNLISFRNLYSRDREFYDSSHNGFIKLPLKSYWGKPKLAVYEKRIEKDQKAMDNFVGNYYSEMPRPIFTIEAFMQDAGAKTWDLRITSDSFLPTASDITAIKI